MDAIHLPNAITLPTAFGAPGTPLPAGQIVQALVLELIQSDVFRLQLPQAVVDVRTDVPLVPGSTITVVPKGTGANTRLTLYSDGANSDGPTRAAPSTSGHVAPSLAGKQPIGEAIIIRATPAAPQASVEPKTADAAAVRDAPSISPARQPHVPAQPAPAPRNITPQQALGEAVRVAASRQTGLAPLLADVEQVVQARPSALPAPVRAAAEQVLALRVPLAANLPAPDLKLAFARSGVLFEPRLAAEGRAPPQSPHALPPKPAPAPAADLKAALIVFRQVLKAWANETAPARPIPSPPAPPASAPAQAEPMRPAPAETINVRQLASALAGEAEMPATAPLSPEQATILAKTVAAALTGREAPEHAASANPNAPPPPYRGAPLAAQQPAAAAIAPDTPPHETAERLLGATEGALARTTLLQAASLPDQPGAQRSDPATQRWTFEVPFATPQGTGIAQFEVSRDGRAARDEERAPVWRARFSLDLEPMGPVHALVALAGERASVTLWAERAATAARLNEQSHDAERCVARGRAGACRLPVPRRGAAGCRAARHARQLHGSRHMNKPVPLAVALQYDKSAVPVPRVVAKGRGDSGEAILALAREHGVPIEENAPLAEALAQVEIGDDIPEALYRAVAEVLVFILRASGKLS